MNNAKRGLCPCCNAAEISRRYGYMVGCAYCKPKVIRMNNSERDLESKIESNCVELVRDAGGVALKLIHDGDQAILGFPRKGTPDRTLLLPGGRIVFVEIKRPGGNLSIHQQKWIRSLRRLGFRVSVIYNVEELQTVLTQFSDADDLREMLNDPE